MRRAEQLVDVALAVADMDTSWRPAEKHCGLRQILKPSHALLLLDGNPRGIDLLLERVGALELLARPELDCRQPERQPFCRHREARMHQDAANRVRSHPAFLVPAAVDAFRRADEGGLFSLIDELRGVMEDQHRTAGCRKAIPRRLKMAAQDVCFADPLIRKEAVGRFGVRPILTNQGNALAHGAPDPLQQLSEFTAKPGIFEGASGNLVICPCHIFPRRAALDTPLPKRHRRRHSLRYLHGAPPCRESGAQQ